eukprot:123262-Amphidinium_carterae.1
MREEVHNPGEGGVGGVSGCWKCFVRSMTSLWLRGVLGVSFHQSREVNLPTLLGMSDAAMIELFAERGLWIKRQFCDGDELG